MILIQGKGANARIQPSDFWPTGQRPRRLPYRTCIVAVTLNPKTRAGTCVRWRMAVACMYVSLFLSRWAVGAHFDLGGELGSGTLG